MEALTQTLSRDELVKLCAVDSEFYARTFFPKTFRQESPVWANMLWEPLEDPKSRLVNLVCYRGSSKTTRLRTFSSKRIAYGISRTILYISAAESGAIASVQWLRTQVEKNTFWAQTFGLKKGRKWEETLCEIQHEVFGHSIWITAAGINGSLRGINFEDYRPDLIVIDDPQTDETAATQPQREKVADLLLGAVRNSLASVADEPNAKMAMAITPQHKEDVSQQALKDDEYRSVVIPCWTKETLNLPVDQQVSSWEVMFPTVDLRNQKRLALRRNKLSIFTREMECRLTSIESAQFRPSWLNIREPNTTPRGIFSVLAIDPVPPPSDVQMAKGLQGKDFEAHYVWGRLPVDGNIQYHLQDCDRNRGHQPSWTIATAFRLARLWRVGRIVVDAVAYQRTLKWILEQEMKKTGIYYQIIPIADGMKKFARIVNVFSGHASAGNIWIGPEHTIFAQQFEEYGPTYGGIDDDIDSSALAVQELSNPYLSRLNKDGTGLIDDNVEDMPLIRSCP